MVKLTKTGVRLQRTIINQLKQIIMKNKLILLAALKENYQN